MICQDCWMIQLNSRNLGVVKYTEVISLVEIILTQCPHKSDPRHDRNVNLWCLYYGLYRHCEPCIWAHRPAANLPCFDKLCPSEKMSWHVNLFTGFWNSAARQIVQVWSKNNFRLFNHFEQSGCYFWAGFSSVRLINEKLNICFCGWCENE